MPVQHFIGQGFLPRWNIAVRLIFFIALAPGFAFAEAQVPGQTHRFLHSIVDTRELHRDGSGNAYGFAPAVVVDGNKIHVWYCSNVGDPGLSPCPGETKVDWIRYAESDDGRVFRLSTTPAAALYPPCNGVRPSLAACDPCVIRVADGGQDWWYMYYTDREVDEAAPGGGMEWNVPRLARALVNQPQGPFQHLCADGVWRVVTTAPKTLFLAEWQTSGVRPGTGHLGSGMQTVVRRPDPGGSGAVYYSWNCDDTEDAGFEPRLYMRMSSQPHVWGSFRVQTNVVGEHAVSADIKWSDELSAFVMIRVDARHTAASRVVARASADGVIWSAPIVLIPNESGGAQPAGMPDWSHNLGFSSDPLGSMVGLKALLVYGSPWFFAPTHRHMQVLDPSTLPAVPCCGNPYLNGRWWLTAHFLSLDPAFDATALWNDVPWGWQWVDAQAPTIDTFLAADYDGDGVPDRTLVRSRPNVDAEWFVISSSASPHNAAPLGHISAVIPKHADPSVDCPSIPPAPCTTGCGPCGTEVFQVGVNNEVGFEWGWKWGGQRPHHLPICGDFDGDAKSDRALFDPQIGCLYAISSATGSLGIPHPSLLGEFTFPWEWKFPQEVNAGLVFPSIANELVFADYTGDGRVDPAIFVRTTGRWYLVESETGDPSGPSSPVPWGWQWGGLAAGSVVMARDIDGDGKADRVAFDRGLGKLHVVDTASGALGGGVFPWGWQFPPASSMGLTFPMQSHQTFLLADLTGDGKPDPIIVDAASTRWFIIRSEDGLPAPSGWRMPWGWTWAQMPQDHQIIFADFDQDGLEDPCVIDRRPRVAGNPAAGYQAKWHVLSSRSFSIR